jgi:hypothetical protein
LLFEFTESRMTDLVWEQEPAARQSVLVVAFAFACDGALLALQKLLTPWTRKARSR